MGVGGFSVGWLWLVVVGWEGIGSVGPGLSGSGPFFRSELGQWCQKRVWTAGSARVGRDRDLRFSGNRVVSDGGFGWLGRVWAW